MSLLKYVQRAILYYIQRREWKNMMKDLHLLETRNTKSVVKGEKEWLEKWSKLDKKVSPLAYRVYSSYVGEDINILPMDVARNYIEPVLNPGDTRRFYDDKNSLGLLLDKEDMPQTLFRSISYVYYDGEYCPVLKENFMNCFKGVNRVVVKSALGLGGYSVKLFVRLDGDFVDDGGNKLSLDFLESMYNTNFLVQECLEQSDYMSQFNPSSVNTIRMNTYRDVVTGEIHILGAVIRIGSKGSAVDNISSGGMFVGIDDNGKLMDTAFDGGTKREHVFNGIDFSRNEYIIPNYEQVKNLAIKVTKRFPHMHLFAHDIALDKDNNPKIIEVNTSCFTEYFLQKTRGGVFGRYTDSVIDYCVGKKNKISVTFSQRLK